MIRFAIAVTLIISILLVTFVSFTIFSDLESVPRDVKKIIQPGGSIMDKNVENKCERLGIKLYNVDKRMFYH